MRLRPVGVRRRAAPAILLLAALAACAPSPGLYHHADGEGSLVFAPESTSRVGIDRAPEPNLLWGGFYLSNDAGKRLVVEDIAVEARGDCRPLPKPYRDVADSRIGLEAGLPGDFELAPLFSRGNARLGAAESMFVVFAIDGADCDAASTTSYGPIEVFYREGEKHMVGTYDYFFDVGW